MHRGYASKSITVKASRDLGDVESKVVVKRPDAIVLLESHVARVGVV